MLPTNSTLQHLFLKKTFITYCFFGAIAALVELSSFYFLITFVPLHYIAAAPLAFILAAITNYTLQRRFTFKNTYSQKHKQFSVFLVIAMGGLAINWLITIFGVEVLGLLPLFAKVLAILAGLSYNYTLNKKVTFGKMQ